MLIASQTRFLLFIGLISLTGFYSGACTRVEVLEEVIVLSQEEASKLLQSNAKLKSTEKPKQDKKQETKLATKQVAGGHTAIYVKNTSLADLGTAPKKDVDTRSTAGYISYATYQGPGNRDHYYSAAQANKSSQYKIDPAKIPCTCAAAETKGWCKMMSSQQNFTVMKYTAKSCSADCSTAPQAARKVCVSH